VLRLGLVGAGPVMQRIHLPSLRALADVEVVALADVDRGLGGRVASAFGIPRTYGDAADLVAGEEGLDGVVVVAGKQWHAAACLPALRRGLPVFTEKPLASTLADARAMVEAARASGSPLMVGYMKRYDPAVLEAERRLREGALGRVRYARLHDFGGNFVAGALGVGTLPVAEAPPRAQPAAAPPAPPPPPPGPEELRRRAFDQWIEVWIHDLNLTQGLIGPVEEVLWSREGVPKLALVRCAGGAEVLLEMGGPQAAGAPWDETVDVFGTEGRLHLGFPPPFLRHAPTLLRLEWPSRVEEPRTGYAEAFTEEMRAFCRMLQGGPAVPTDGAMGLRDMQLAAAIADRAHPGCEGAL
jgi:predicted dehydrogenase